MGIYAANPVILWRHMKHSAEYDAFTSLVDRVLAVPHGEIFGVLEE